MKGINERELLPIVRAVISGNNGEIGIFMKAIEPIRGRQLNCVKAVR